MQASLDVKEEDVEALLKEDIHRLITKAFGADFAPLIVSFDQLCKRIRMQFRTITYSARMCVSLQVRAYVCGKERMHARAHTFSNPFFFG